MMIANTRWRLVVENLIDPPDPFGIPVDAHFPLPGEFCACSGAAEDERENRHDKNIGRMDQKN
jgi:hypothetical protein